MDDEGQPSARGDPASRCDDDPEALDLRAGFRTAFARNCTFAHLGDSERCSMTVVELAELCELMYVAGFDAALEEIGYGYERESCPCGP